MSDKLKAKRVVNIIGKRAATVRKSAKNKPSANDTKQTHSDLHRLYLLFTVVNRKKTEFYMDFIQTNYEVNMQLSLAGTGTASTELLNVLGLTDSEKGVIISVIRDEQAMPALRGLEEKFATIKNGKGIAYTVPVSSTVGVAIYQFLANLQPKGVI